MDKKSMQHDGRVKQKYGNKVNPNYVTQKPRS